MMEFRDDPAISSGVIALFVFLALAPWWPSQESYRTEIWSVSYSYLVVPYFPAYKTHWGKTRTPNFQVNSQTKSL
jgi:hypothetical protein